ncbi:hypothetical protein JOF43_001555 [Brachybacterium sacelli]|uniref:DNA helicase n=1 Tax=Brachybacterium sacelli TaxID=173364 RepID=A0ABS4WZG0_9MICO|nr:hypothetical protein [Brachybacterium sacelli]
MTSAPQRRPAGGSPDDPADGAVPRRRSLSTLRERWRAFSAGLHEFYVAPYRRTFARARRDEDDLFRLLVMSEMLGVPNPASYYTAELLPVLYDGFHDWHRRMGMERSPLENYRCC